jgi:hypothetical protein
LSTECLEGLTIVRGILNKGEHVELLVKTVVFLYQESAKHPIGASLPWKKD